MDYERIKEVGPNIACAEWLMKNGAQVRWKGCNEYVSHYDCLPNMKCGSSKNFKIEQVYAGQEASISHVGFHYFSKYYLLKYKLNLVSNTLFDLNCVEDCENISDIAFVGCHTINNEALSKLGILKNSLTSLKVNGCINVSDEGILSLECLQ